MDDPELEQTMRAGLSAKAEDVEAGRGYAATARRRASRRRRTRVGAAAVAAAVAIAVPVVVMTQDDSARDETATNSPTTGDVTASSRPAVDVPADWRVESYDGVQLRVPPDWGWGGVPANDGAVGKRQPCDMDFPAARPTDDGRMKFGGVGRIPYVGRPGYGFTDLCDSRTDLRAPTAAWVWFDTGLPVGLVQRERGFAQHTVEVAGMRVTVGGREPNELDLILSSIEKAWVDDNGCGDGAVAPYDVTPRDGELRGIGETTAVVVCVYRNWRHDVGTLTYSTRLDGEEAAAVTDAITSTPPPPVARACALTGATLDSIVLRFIGTQGDMIVNPNLQCGWYGRGAVPLTADNVQAWAVDAVGLYTNGGVIPPLIFYPAPG